MTSSKKSPCESIKYLIPLYVKDRLTDKQKAEVEKALAECPELQRELKEWEEIKKTYQQMEKEPALPSKSIYPRIISRIREDKKSSFFERLRQRASDITMSPAFSMSVIAVQFLIIIALGGYLITQQSKYRTLSAPQAIHEDLVRINIVFREDATEIEIRNLLLQINAKVIDGPYSSGLYVIGLSPEEIENKIERLRENRIVILSERDY